ncbi:MAG TPA: response regulator [Candidatus Nanoarchaeia archaeon]|nr:response regulator [Candidatus Nanoarchaeia archaeon]
MAQKILVVDDNLSDLETMKQILRKAGYKVTAASDGAQALDSLKASKFDLILIDILMPTFSGYDLVRVLRSQLDGKVRVVFVSIVPKKEVDMADIDGFIQKPFDVKYFVAEVKKALRKELEV